MLRNPRRESWPKKLAILNEVLSLNAQELTALCGLMAKNIILNEVLSLNAQES